MELLTMTSRELDKIKVINDVLQGKLKWKEAAAQLNLQERQIGNLCAKVRGKGSRGVIHGLRGRLSNRRLDLELLEHSLSTLHDPLWEGFGPTFAKENLQTTYGIVLGTETLRRLMILAGLWEPHRRRARHRAWRQRRACIAMLVQLDGSEHAWFEGRGPRCTLILYIDDATGRILYGEFVKTEDTLTLMRITRTYLKRWGRVIAFYVDKGSIYRINCKATVEDQLRNTEAMSQFTRAMGELDIQVIFANSPQAKGRVERSFKTHQDRLVKELRLKGISTIEQANEFLWKTYIPGHNARFARMPADPIDAHRPLLKHHRLEEILALRTERTLLNDFTLRYKNRFFQVLRNPSVRMGPRDKVQVVTRMDGTIRLRYKDQYIKFKTISKRSERPFIEKKEEAHDVGRELIPHKPAKNHPWRKGFKYMSPPDRHWYEPPPGVPTFV